MQTKRNQKIWRDEVSKILSGKVRLAAVAQIWLTSLACLSPSDSGHGLAASLVLGSLLVLNLLRLSLSTFPKLRRHLGLAVWRWSFSVLTRLTGAAWGGLGLVILRAEVQTESGADPYLVVIALLGASVFAAAHRSVQRKSFAELVSERARNRALLDNSFEAILAHEDGVILDVNESFLRMYGGSREDIVGERVETLVPVQEIGAVEERLSLLRTTPDNIPWRGWGRRADGSVFPIEVRATSVYHDERHIRLIFAQDVSARVQAEEASRFMILRERDQADAHQQLNFEAAMKRERELAVWRKEVKSPLRGIAGLSELLRTEPLSPTQNAMLKDLSSCVDRLHDLLEGLPSRLEDQGLPTGASFEEKRLEGSAKSTKIV